VQIPLSSISTFPREDTTMNLKHLIRKSAAIVLACMALGTASVSQSALLYPTGFAYGSQSFGLANGNTNLGSPSAGAFVGTLDGVPIVFFCAELGQTFSFNPGPNVPYVYSVSLPNDATFTLLGKLFTEAFSLVDTTQESAAFQLAVWEILFGSDLNLTNVADFHVTNDNGNTATVQLAQSWLDNLGADNADVYRLSNRDHQDFVFGGPPGFFVPEPAPLMLLGIGLLGMLAFTRRGVRTQKH
jgi:hypothetical protein